MKQEETDKIFNAITSNGCRDMDEVRFNQAVNEALEIVKNYSILDVVGQSEQFTFEDMRKSFDAGAWEHHLHTFDSWIKTQK